jgi:sugar-specific transcriptional regulator TrmB
LQISSIRAESVVQVVEQLPSKHEALSSNSSTDIKSNSIEFLKKNQMEIVVMKSSISEIKISVESFINRLDQGTAHLFILGYNLTFLVSHSLPYYYS